MVAEVAAACRKFGIKLGLYLSPWDRISALIHELQPRAMVFNMGAPTIRWVGNADGLAADPVRCVVTETDFSNYMVHSAALTEALYLPPDTRGLIPEEEVARVAEFSAEVRRRFASPRTASLSAVGGVEGEDPQLASLTAYVAGVAAVPEIKYLAPTGAPD